MTKLFVIGLLFAFGLVLLDFAYSPSAKLWGKIVRGFAKAVFVLLCMYYSAGALLAINEGERLVAMIAGGIALSMLALWVTVARMNRDRDDWPLANPTKKSR